MNGRYGGVGSAAFRHREEPKEPLYRPLVSLDSRGRCERHLVPSRGRLAGDYAGLRLSHEDEGLTAVARHGVRIAIGSG